MTINRNRDERRKYKAQYMRDKKNVIIALSAYSTHNKNNTSIDTWLDVNTMSKDKHTSLNQQLRKLGVKP